MSTSRWGNICVMLPKCSRKEGRRDFSNRSSVEATMTGRSCVFLGESKSTLFGLPKVDAFRNHWLRLVCNIIAQLKCLNFCNAFYGRPFCEPSFMKQGRRIRGVWYHQYQRLPNCYSNNLDQTIKNMYLFVISDVFERSYHWYIPKKLK